MPKTAKAKKKLLKPKNKVTSKAKKAVTKVIFKGFLNKIFIRWYPCF